MQLDARERELITATVANIDEEVKRVCFDYYRCAHFMEIMAQFSEDKLTVPEEWTERREYCLFKAGIGRSPGTFKVTNSMKTSSDKKWMIVGGNPFESAAKEAEP